MPLVDSRIFNITAIRSELLTPESLALTLSIYLDTILNTNTYVFWAPCGLYKDARYRALCNMGRFKAWYAFKSSQVLWGVQTHLASKYGRWSRVCIWWWEALLFIYLSHLQHGLSNWDSWAWFQGCPQMGQLSDRSRQRGSYTENPYNRFRFIPFTCQITHINKSKSSRMFWR